MARSLEVFFVEDLVVLFIAKFVVDISDALGDAFLAPNRLVVLAADRARNLSTLKLLQLGEATLTCADDFGVAGVGVTAHDDEEIVGR